MTQIYKDILKAAKNHPVFIDVTHPDYSYYDRMRILYPDGRCEWDIFDFYDTYIDTSCFAYESVSLEQTIINMESFDIRSNLTIVQFQVLK